MRVISRGDPTLQPRHAKSAELIFANVGATDRQSCVAGIGAEYLEVPSRPLRGRLQITVSSAGLTTHFTGYANAAWSRGASLVIRRGAVAIPGTFATDSDLTAKKLTERFGATLQRSESRFEWDFEEVEQRTHSEVCLYYADPRLGVSEDLENELEAADAVIAEDSYARSVLKGRTATPIVGMEEVLGYSRRILVVSSLMLPGETAGRLLVDNGTFIETRNLPAILAPVAASPSNAPIRFLAAKEVSARRLQALAGSGMGSRVSFMSSGSGLVELVAALGTGHVGLCVMSPYGRPTQVRRDWTPSPRSGQYIACAYLAETNHGATTDTGQIFDTIAGSVLMSAVISCGVNSLRSLASEISVSAALPRNAVYQALVDLRASVESKADAIQSLDLDLTRLAQQELVPGLADRAMLESRSSLARGTCL